ncbi:MAG: hypothetical protein ACKO6N_01650 [Myxococcota bacterium]
MILIFLVGVEGVSAHPSPSEVLPNECPGSRTLGPRLARSSLTWLRQTVGTLPIRALEQPSVQRVLEEVQQAHQAQSLPRLASSDPAVDDAFDRAIKRLPDLLSTLDVEQPSLSATALRAGVEHTYLMHFQLPASLALPAELRAETLLLWSAQHFPGGFRVRVASPTRVEG